MKMRVLILGVAVLCLGAAPVMAEAPSLQEIFDYITVDGSSTVDASSPLADTGPGLNDSYWTIDASGTSVATLIIEVAGNANTNAFGIYELNNNTITLAEVFAGSINGGGFDGSAEITFLKDYVNGGWDVGVENVHVADFAGTTFGFYLSTASGLVFYSDSSLNADAQTDHMQAFQGTGDLVQIKSWPGVDPAWAYAPGDWEDNEWALAFEDLPITSPDYDGDYNDFVVMVESVQPVPVPGAVLLGVLGLSAAGIRLRRFA